MKNLHFFHKLPKELERGHKGLCFLCHKHVRNIKAHMKSKHKASKR